MSTPRPDAAIPLSKEALDHASRVREDGGVAAHLARRALVFEYMQGGVIITDRAARIVDWNPAAEHIFGYAKEEMLGRTVRRLYRTDGAADLERTILAEIERNGSWTGELPFVRKDGTEGVCETTVAPVLDERGERVATIGINHDITARRATELALTQSHGMIRAVVDGTTDAVFVKDVHGRYVMINEAGSRMMGKPVEEIIGRDDTSFFAAGEAAAIVEIDRRVMERGEPYTFEETITAAGATRHFSTTKAPWRDAQGRTVGLIGIARDVSERWQAEEEARRHRAELAHVLRVRTVGEMAAGLGHEINQPLGAIANYAEGCVRRLRAGAAEGELIVALEEISAQAWRAGSIVRRLGEFVRKQPARLEVVGLDSLVRGAVRLIEREARQDEVAIELRLDPDLIVRVDPVQIEQVVLNVLLNGLEAMREAPVHRLALSISTRRAAVGVAEVEIRDGGAGLPKDQASRIFDPFFTTKPHGLGMGLAISRSIVEAHGGSLRAEDSREGGATFLLRLPTVGSSPPTAPPPAPRSST